MRYDSLRHGLVLAICPSVSGGGGIVPDLSGRGNHGTLTNMDASDYVAYHRGIALDTDGVNDSINTNQSNLFEFTSSNSQFTLSLFAQDRSGNSFTNAISKNANGASADGGYYVSLSQNVAGTDATKAHCIIYLASGVWVGVDFDFPQNSWRHVAMIVNMGLSGTNRVEAYVNGLRTGTKFSQGTGTAILSNTRSLRIGSDAAGNFIHNGQLDDVRVYNRAISETEIQLLASEPGIGLRPERKSVFFGAQLFNPAWARRQQLIGSGVY